MTPSAGCSDDEVQAAGAASVRAVQAVAREYLDPGPHEDPLAHLTDVHLHMGNMRREGYPEGVPTTVHCLIDRMNREGIEKGLLLPLESPEGHWGYFTTEEAVAARDLFPERLIAFCCVDPRYPGATDFIDYAVTRLGCKGFGEHINGLAFNDPQNRALYAKCDEHGLPLIFDMDHFQTTDTVGLPGLEACLRDFRNITWVGHGPRFWAAISGDDVDGAPCYPQGPITPGGAIDRLLDQYDHLWLDLSAGSGFNALTRDPDFTPGFVERYWRRMMFGTDWLTPGQTMPIVRWLQRLEAPKEVRRAIAWENAWRLLGME